MTTELTTATETYRCPECGGVLATVGGTWGCSDCRYTPPHGAD